MTNQTITEADIAEAREVLSESSAVLAPWGAYEKTQLPHGVRVVAWAVAAGDAYVFGVFHGREFGSWHADPDTGECYSGSYYYGYSTREAAEKFLSRIAHRTTDLVFPQ